MSADLSTIAETN